MEAIDPGDQFRVTFTQPARELLINALSQAVATARETHLPERGGNEITFGLGTYHYAVHELTEAVQQNPDFGFRPFWRRQAFRLQAGDYTLACHKVGNRADENIWGCFPNPGAAHTLVLDQGRPNWLPGLEPKIAASRAVVLAYMCNPDRGLEAVYLCIPTQWRGESITEWGFAEPIWVRVEAASSGDSPMNAPLAPAEEQVAMPLVALKPRRETQS